MYEEYLEDILRPLLKTPEKLAITKSVDEMGVLLTVSVDHDDMGVIIGREGAHAKAIRTLLRIYGGQHNAALHMKVLEPYNGKYYKKAAELGEVITDFTSSTTIHG